MDNLLGPFLITSAVPFLLTAICIVAAGLAFLRQTELGAAALPAGFGFAALAASSAIRIAMFYVQFSGMAHHTPTSEIARVLGLGSLGGRVFEIGGVVLVAVAMFQRRPSER
jgi:hypothetical protein